MSTSSSLASLLPLTCFVRVVEAGSFAEAGRRLGMTTSGVSRAISRFEAEHGVRLLHRSTHAVSLTYEGERLFDEAREMLYGAERFGRSLAEAADGGRRGRVRIGAPAGFVRARLLPILPSLLDTHPKIQVEVRSTYALNDLAAEGVDIALRTGALVGLPGHIARPLISSPWCLYGAPAYLSRRGTPALPRDLDGHDLIGFRNAGEGRMGAWHFQDSSLESAKGIIRYEADARVVFDDGASAYELARGGHGLVWAPEWLALDDLHSGRVVEVLREWRSREMRLSLVRGEQRLAPERTRVVANVLFEAAKLWRM